MVHWSHRRETDGHQGSLTMWSTLSLLRYICFITDIEHSVFINIANVIITTTTTTTCKFLTPALDDGLSLESEWLKVYSSLRDSSQYSGRP